jgi:hypothetical protein
MILLHAFKEIFCFLASVYMFYETRTLPSIYCRIYIDRLHDDLKAAATPAPVRMLVYMCGAGSGLRASHEEEWRGGHCRGGGHERVSMLLDVRYLMFH